MTASRAFTKAANARTTLAKLLQHGPLSRGEAITITGWPARRCDRAIEGLLKANEVRRVHLPQGRWYAYRLTDTARVRAFAEVVS